MMSLQDRAATLLDSLSVGDAGPRRIGKLVAYDGQMLEATGLAMPVGASVRVIDADGHATRAEIVGFKGDRSLMMALDADAPHSNGGRVEPDANGGIA